MMRVNFTKKALRVEHPYRMSARGEKLLDMGLLKEEEEDALHHSSSSSKLELPKELPRGHSAKTD